MTKPRVVETDTGIQGEYNVEIIDRMQRHLRDRGWIETKQILRSGIDSGRALEVGPGPGYLGLEWLKMTSDTTLVGLDISPDMLALAKRNAAEYGSAERAEYVLGSGNQLPFADNAFDAVFSNGSLHEWSDPSGSLDEAWRVLKPGGRLHITDLRRDMAPPVRWFLWLFVKPREVRPGLITSINAAYTAGELEQLVARCAMAGNAAVARSPLGVSITARKPA